MDTMLSEDCLVFLKRHVPAGQFDRFLRACSRFKEILYETNRTMNLTRIPENEFWSKHIADSISIAPYLKGKFNLCDVGCGAGFPSLPLAAAFPELQVTAVDSTRKKIDFVLRAAEAMELDNLEALHARANELAHEEDYNRHFDLVTARAVADSVKLVREVSGLLRKNACLYVYRTPDQRDREKPELQKLAMRFQCTETFQLPDDAGTRLFMILPGVYKK